MPIEKLIWRDEELAPVQTAAGADYGPRYSIIGREGQIVAEGAKLALLSEVVVAGTLHNADNMNSLLQKCDAVGSFYYEPLANEMLYDFAKPGLAADWRALPPCPADIGQDAVTGFYKGKIYVTMGRGAACRSASKACAKDPPRPILVREYSRRSTH